MSETTEFPLEVIEDGLTLLGGATESQVVNHDQGGAYVVGTIGIISGYERSLLKQGLLSRARDAMEKSINALRSYTPDHIRNFCLKNQGRRLSDFYEMFPDLRNAG
ncbi:hypothetical protein CMI48_00495 [Candidatus Pacearchaeota archaeon]|nr:hypothetical protein [Candidatus Pacearchaeota archaeon]|tara:strand:- start:269 stop:586 length:318 start_codon:yes stop_codon:yes gene_type:complete